MPITVNVHGQIASIVLTRNIDYSMQDEFNKANKEALSAKGVTEIHVDFTETAFLDSSGIRALVVLQRGVEESGKSLFLLNCNKKLLRVFEISGLDQTFNFR